MTEYTEEQLPEYYAWLNAYNDGIIDRAEFVVRTMAIHENWSERKITRKIMLRRFGRTIGNAGKKILKMGM